MGITVGHTFWNTAERHSAAPAIRSPDAELTYGRLSVLADAIAEVVRGESLAGRRVGILLGNGAAYPAVLHGIFRTGGSALLLNPANSGREIREQLADAGVREVVTVENLYPLLPEYVTSLLVDELPASIGVRRGGATDRNPLSPDPPPARDFAGVDSEAVVIFTSALNGRARGAVLTHRNLVANLRSTRVALGLTREDRVLATLPFAHGFGLTVCLNLVLSGGAEILAMPRFNPVAALDQLESLKPTVIAGVPAMYRGLLTAADTRGVPVHDLRVALCGGAPLPREVQRRWEESFGLPLRQGYGLTEAAPVCLFNSVDRPNVVGTLGAAIPDVEVSVRDGAGDELPEGEVGELCVRGENVFRGYLGDASRGPFWGEWLRTGDLCSRSGELFTFRGTVKQMFTRNGFNVYPAEIRRVLLEDPRIASVNPCARPDAGHENEIVLEVFARRGTELSEDDVRARCRAKLASYKQPARVRIVHATP